MFIPKTQIALLKDIFEGFELEINIDDQIAGQIYESLFLPSNRILEFAHPALNDTVYTLKDIVEMNQLTTLEGILAFFYGEDRAIDECMTSILRDVEQAQVVAVKEEDEPDDCTIKTVGNKVATRQLLSRFAISGGRSGREFEEGFSEQISKSRSFFYRFLQQNGYGMHMMADLLQQTSMLAWYRYNDPKYRSEPMDVLFKRASYDALTDTAFDLKNESDLKKIYRLEMDTISSSCEDAFEARDIFMKLRMRNIALFEVLVFQMAGYSLKEICGLLGVSMSILYRKITRGRKVLMKQLEKKYL